MNQDRRIHLPLLLLTSLSVVATLAPATFAVDGHTVWNTVERAPIIEDAYAHAEHARAVSDGNGGVVVVWQHQFAGGIRIQRLSHAGVQQWVVTGRELSTTGYAPEIAVHPDGGFVVAWYESGASKTGIYAQRVNSAGVPSWTPGGAKIATTATRPVICATSSAGTFVAWQDSTTDARIGNIDDAGIPTTPGVDGVSLGANVGYTFDMNLVPSGTGSVIAIWTDDSSPNRIVAQKVGPGFPWGTTPSIVGAPAGRFNHLPVADSDGAGGAVVAWRTGPWTVTGVQYRAQRINSSGVPQWATGGEVLVDSTVVGGEITLWNLNNPPSIASNGEGGAFVAWDDPRRSIPGDAEVDIFIQHLGPSGSQVWDAYGIPLSPDISGSERSPQLVTDGAGGVLPVYEEFLNLGAGDNWEVMAARLDGLGNRHWEYPPYNDANMDAIDQLDGLVVFDGSGPAPQGAIYVWLDAEDDNLYAQKVEVSRPPGDDCGQAIEVVHGDYEFNLAGSTTDMQASCGGVDADIWLRFFAPANGTLVVSTCGTNDFPVQDEGVDTVLSFHSACPDGGATFEHDCNDDWGAGECSAEDSGLVRDSYLERPLVGGEEVLIRVSRYSSSFNGLVFVHVRFEQAPPPNDNCADAIPIGTGTHIGSLIAATTDSLTSCAGSESDVWYRYTAPAASTHRFFTCGTNDMGGIDQGIDSVLSIHSACPETGNIHQLTCNDDAGGACEAMDQGATSDSLITYFPTAGENIWIRVARFTASFDGEFLLHIEAEAPAAGRVPNDQVFGGEPLRVTKFGSEVILTWGASCLSSDTDFSVYTGPMTLYGMHEPVTCTTGGMLEHRLLPPTGDNYFIVVPHNGMKEGSHGTHNPGFGPLERLPSPAVCYPQEIAACP